MKKSILTIAVFLFGILSAVADNISVADVTIMPGETATVGICLNNTETNLLSFQMDLTLPEGISVNKAGCSLSSRFTDEDQELTIGRLSNGDIRLTSSSFSLTPIAGTSGEIIILSLTAAANSQGGTATISNIRFVTSDLERLTLPNTTFNISCPVLATGISLNQTSLSFTAANQTATLTATVTPSNATNKSVTWTSSNTSVATVSSSGVVTAKANGTATITAKTADGTNLTATCTVTVAIPVLATGISLNQTSLSFTAANQTATLTATVTPSNATNKSVTWTSSNTSVATVSSTGVVTAKANGTATITAKTADGTNLTATCTVTVAITQDLELTYGDIYYNLGSEGVWTSSNTNVAYIQQADPESVIPRQHNSYIHTRNAGSATITGPRTIFLTVNKAPLTITAKSYTINHGDPLPNFEVEYSGFIIRLDMNYLNDGNMGISDDERKLTTKPTISCSATSTSAPGTYDINVSGAVADNYSFTYVKGTLTINAKSVSGLTINSIDAVTYNGSAQTPTVTVMDGNTTLTEGTDYTVAYSNNIKAGTATVTITGKGNYTGTKSATFTINKAPLTVTAESYTITQGDPLPTYRVTYSGFVNNETSSVLITQPTISCSATSSSVPGTYDILVSGAAAANYEFTYVNGTLTINAKSVSSLTINSIDAVTYNGLAQTPTVTVMDGNTTLTEGTDYTVAYSNNIKAGTATVTITGKGNYTGTKSATFTINKAPLTVTAESYTITQGDPLPTYRVTYSGFVNNETSSVLITQPTISCSATSSSVPGTYDINVSGAVADNYSFTYVKGTLTINAKSVSNLTIISIDAVTYNGLSQTPTVTVMDGNTTMTEGTDYTVAYSDNINVGTATVTITGIGNYIGTKTASFTINKAMLTITANDCTKEEGEENPELTVSYSGFVNGEDETVLTTQPTVTTTATTSSPEGTYPITVSGAEAANYDFTYVDGTLTVTEKYVIVVTDISQLDNAVYIEPFAARVGAEVQLVINLKNAEEVSAYIFDMELPEGVTVATNSNGKYIDALSDRHDDHSRTINYKGNNVYSLSVLSANSEVLTGNDGAIRFLTLLVADDMEEGVYAINIRNASFSRPNASLVEMENTTSTITIEDYLLGDVNGNNGIDIADAVCIVNYLVGKPNQTFIEKAADTNKNGKTDIGDAVAIVNYLVGKTESLAPQLILEEETTNERDPD